VAEKSPWLVDFLENGNVKKVSEDLLNRMVIAKAPITEADKPSPLTMKVS